jgi:molybdopterin molybdotransferase
MSVIDDCFAFSERRLPHSEAIALLKTLPLPIAESEPVDLFHATGRVLAEILRAPRDVPAHTNAAVDGFAFAYADYDAEAGSRMKISARLAAGDSPTAIEKGAACRIFTGAILPEGSDTVAMQEDCSLDASGGCICVRIPGGLTRGANRRRAGEDMKAGNPIASPGQRLRPQDVAALATAGFGSVRCFRPPRVMLFSTGNEVIRPGQDFAEGKVYDANAAMLAGLLAPAGAIVTDGGVLPDNAARVREALEKAAGAHDLIITSGGASLGEEDHVVASLRALGALSLWQLAIKPGRPMGVGKLGRTIALALPGNPVAVFVCALLYVWPLLLAQSGMAGWFEPRRLTFPAHFTIEKRKKGRREFFRGWLAEEGGRLWAEKYPRDGSGLISSLRAADGLIEIPEERGAVAAGEDVAFIPLSEFGISERPRNRS